MACSCNKAKQWTVKLKGGLSLTRKTQAEALALAAKHTGAWVIAPTGK
jgi:hypothetical protein